VLSTSVGGRPRRHRRSQRETQLSEVLACLRLTNAMIRTIALASAILAHGVIATRVAPINAHHCLPMRAETMHDTHSGSAFFTSQGSNLLGGLQVFGRECGYL
jgi:hypothetical protein